jgi:hypothetical protein
MAPVVRDELAGSVVTAMLVLGREQDASQKEVWKGYALTNVAVPGSDEKIKLAEKALKEAKGKLAAFDLAVERMKGEVAE